MVLDIKTGFVLVTYSPMITGIFGLIIPAFSKAMASSVFPKNCVWSNPIFVITEINGVIILERRQTVPRGYADALHQTTRGRRR